MKLRYLTRSVLYGAFLIFAALMTLLYWFNSNHLIIESFKFGPVQIKSLDLKLSKGFQSEKLLVKLGDLDISLSDVSVNWSKWRFLLGNFDSVVCREVKFKLPEFDQNKKPVGTDSRSLINHLLTRRLNVNLIRLDSIKSINSELEASSITANLSGSQLNIQGSNFNMRFNDKESINAPIFRGKFHFPTNRLVLEKSHLNINKLGNLEIIDLDLPINLKPGASIACREIYLGKLDQILRNFRLKWRNDNTYQSSFELDKAGKLIISRLLLDQSLNLNELKLDATNFELNLELLWLDNLLKGLISELASKIPNPLVNGDISPKLNTGETLRIKLDGNLHLSKQNHLKNKVNLNASLQWTSSDSKNVLIQTHIKHNKEKLGYEIMPLQVLITENNSNIWQTILSTKIAYSDKKLNLNQLNINKIEWKDKLTAIGIKSNEFSIDSKSKIIGSISCKSINFHKVLTSGVTNIKLSGKPNSLEAQITLQNLSVLDFGTAKNTQAHAKLNEDQLQLKFDIKNYSKMNSFSRKASGSMTWSPAFSEGLIQISTGSISLGDYLNFDSSDKSIEDTSSAAYRWTIQGQTILNDEQLKGNTSFKLVFDHRFEGPSGSAELRSGVLKLAGNKFTLIEPARLKLFPKPKAKYQDELLVTLQSHNHSQTLTEQLQAMWNASNPNDEKYFEHGIWIHLIAGVKFRGEDVEIKISGKYPQLRFRLNSLSGKSDKELLNSFLGSLQNQLSSDSTDNAGVADQYKQGANLLVNTMIDSFFGSVFNNLGTQFHTQIGSSEQSSVGIQQPLGDNLSVGLTQSKEGNIETKSKNFELQFKPGSSIRIENIEKDGYQNETQVEIQKRFRF
ncbi:MAG: hypothetical protein VX619_11475 [bacterium]|nr:hypothetical protein [bacterium]